MKFVVVLAAIVLAVNATTDEELWLQFKEKHGKSYRNLKEERLRFNVFKDNLRKIESHNARFHNGDESYYMGVNKFADKTQEEFRQGLNYKQSKFNVTRTKINVGNVAVPDTFDWRDLGAVLEVKDQHDCGACWAFSATGAMEGQNAIQNNVMVPLSEQILMDCSTSYGTAGCDGGEMTAAFQYVVDNGDGTEADFPYLDKDSTCMYTSSNGVIQLSSYVVVDQSEEELKKAIATQGPVSIAIDARNLNFYTGGIYNDKSCSSTDLDHGVLAIGYGTSEDGEDYWIVKNSWGADWGEEGFVRMIRNDNNHCGVATDASYPVLA